jgi:hypothetical protein
MRALACSASVSGLSFGAELPPGWAWFRAALPDGRTHCFGYARDATAPMLARRAWQIWSPARAGPDGCWLTPGLVVHACGCGAGFRPS